MGRIAPRRRKSTRVYQPLLHTWLSIRQRIMPDAKNVDDHNLMSEVSASEHISPAEDITSTENNVSPETVATAAQEKGIKKTTAENLALAGQFCMDGAITSLSPSLGHYRNHSIAAGTVVASFP